MKNQEAPVMLTVRGKFVPSTVENARVLHNDTAGSAQGIAAARALGDLSHNVFVPGAGAPSGELLFLDTWVDVQGIMEFFSNPHVQQQGGNMFSARDASVWMPARGGFRSTCPRPRAETIATSASCAASSPSPRRRSPRSPTPPTPACATPAAAASSRTDLHQDRPARRHRPPRAARRRRVEQPRRHGRALQHPRPHGPALDGVRRQARDLNLGAGARQLVRVVADQQRRVG